MIEVKRYIYRFLISAMMLILFSSAIQSQQVDPQSILNRLLEIQNQIDDYEAQVEIDVDIEFIKMPVKTARVIYKKPDKMRFRSDEFLMLPKRGLSQSTINNLLESDYNAVYIGLEYIESEPYHHIKVIPYSSKEIVLASLWVDTTTFLVRRMQNFTKSRGNYLVDISYYDEIDLPSELKITFEAKEFNIPLDFINRTIEIDKDKMKSQEVKTGYIYLRFSDYRINQGLDEAMFEDEEGL
jgi:outer membrane lipoprotein-sorting protein